MKIVTGSGFECELDKETNIDDNWDYVEAIGDVMDGVPGAMAKLAKVMLAPADYKALKKHCEKDGKVSSSMMQDELIEIIKAASKNS